MADFIIAIARPVDIEAIEGMQSMIPGAVDKRELEDAVLAGRCFVASSGSAIVGFAVLASWFFGRSFLSRLAVHTDFQRRGIATALIRSARSAAGSELFTSTNRSNIAARRLFEGLEFVPSGIIENLDEGDPELIYYYGRATLT